MNIVVENLAEDFNIDILLKSSSELERIQYSHWRTCNALDSPMDKLYNMDRDFQSFGHFLFKTSDSYFMTILKKYIAARCYARRRVLVIMSQMMAIDWGTPLDLLVEEEMNTEFITNGSMNHSGDVRIKELDSTERELLYGDRFDYFEFEDVNLSDSSMMLFTGQEAILSDKTRLGILGKMTFDDVIDCRSCIVDRGGLFHKFLVNNFKKVLIGGNTSMYFHLYY